MLQLLIRKMGGLVPILGQANHFVMYNKEKSPYGEGPYLDLTTDTNVKEWHVRMARKNGKSPLCYYGLSFSTCC